MAVADELVTILGVNVAKDALAKLESFKNGIDSVKNTLLGLSVVITGFAATTALLVKGAADEAAELEKLSDKTGLSTDALQEWGYAAQKAGGDASAVQKDLAGLQERFMTTGKSAEKMLLDISGRMEGMSGQRANALGKTYGLSDDTIALLKKGKEGVEDLRKEAHKLGGIIPADSIKKAADFKRQMTELQFAFHGLTTQAAIAMIPALSKVVEIFKGWMETNREWVRLGLEALMGGIVSGFERFWGVLTKVAGIFDPLLNAIKPFLGDMDLVEEVTHLVTGALTGLLVVFSPVIAKILLIGAAITAVVWAFEDFFTYLEGGDSVIGGLFDAFEQRWPDLFAAIQSVGQFIRENIMGVVDAAWGVIKTVFGGFVDVIGTVLNGMNALAGPVGTFFSTFEEKFPALSEAFSALGALIKTVLVDAFQFVVDKIKIFIDFIFSALEKVGGVMGTVASGLNTAAEWMGFGDKGKKDSPTGTSSTIPVGGQPARMSLSPSHANTSTQYNDNKQVNITVSSSDPQQAGQATVQALDNTSNITTPGQYAPVAG